MLNESKKPKVSTDLPVRVRTQTEHCQSVKVYPVRDSLSPGVVDAHERLISNGACQEHRRRIFVGLSGGVDSSVAAYLLKERGFDVVGVHLRCWNRNVCNAQDAEDARRVAEYLGLPFYVLNLEEEYKEKVIDYMVSGYAAGITPNPDVMCNKEIKFGLFLKKALEMGADYIATGHYVRLRRKFPISNFQFPNKSKIKKFENLDIKNSLKIENYELKIAKDTNKDQSYFLWTLTQEQLKHCLFPIGDYLKSEVRAIAKKAGLPTAEKKDSQGLCFVGKVALKDFLGENLPPQRGDILDTVGNVLGEHEGVQFYTIGQRHIKISNIKNQKSNSAPLYVVEKNAKTNTIVMAEGSDNPALYKKEIELTKVNFINHFITSLIRANERITILTRVRYRQPLVLAALKIENLKLKIEFDAPVKFVAPGQSAVFYSQKKCMLGGGVIE